MNLARDTNEEKWKKIGEKAVQFMARLVEFSSWNFENKRFLLQAELHYLNGRYRMAELAYQASIVSACEHKFVHEEALAHELFGIYFVENKRIREGIEHLKIAYDKYMQWGAYQKTSDVKDFLELVAQVNWVNLKCV